MPLNQTKMILMLFISIEFYIIICLMYVLHTISFILLDYVVQIIAKNIFILWTYELYCLLILFLLFQIDFISFKFIFNLKYNLIIFHIFLLIKGFLK